MILHLSILMHYLYFSDVQIFRIIDLTQCLSFFIGRPTILRRNAHV